MEPNRKLRRAEILILIILLLTSAVSFAIGLKETYGDPGELEYLGTETLFRDPEEECDEDNTVCPVLYSNGEDSLVVSYPYEEYEELESTEITVLVYEAENGTKLFHDPETMELPDLYREVTAERLMPLFPERSL